MSNGTVSLPIIDRGRKSAVNKSSPVTMDVSILNYIRYFLPYSLYIIYMINPNTKSIYIISYINGYEISVTID